MDCVFCNIVTGKSPAYIVYNDEKYLAFLDEYPQSPGHLQLIPKTHARWIYDIPDMAEIFGLAQKIIHAIIPVLGANHVVMGSFGREIHHAHIWIVPQYKKELKLEEGLKVNYKKNEFEKLTQVIRNSIK